ncbi:MAG: peptidase M16 [Bacteroidetes bacterium CG2_30_32_10]|nr:MAG: peptidase M16 [Bacteroidetes bacterium CG2_30_32_10]
MEYQYATLSNGIRVIHKQVDSIVAHCGIIINTGSRDESEREQGIAHFIEHVIFKGTQKRKAFHILNRLEDVGGELNAFTTKEDTCIYASFIEKYYDRAIELISDIVFNSTFPEKELEKEKDVVIDEINSYKDTPTEAIFDDFEGILFAGHPLGKNILGKKANIKNFKRQEILNFIKNNYHTNEIVISSVGKIQFTKLLRIIEKYISPIPQNLRTTQRIPFENYIPQHKSIRKSYYQTHCVIGNVAYNHLNEKKNSLILLNNILGGPGLNSKLSLAIREKYGFCYNIESLYTPYFDTGIFGIYLATDKEFVEKTISLTFKELEKLKKNKLSDLQLKKYKQQLIGQIAISNESNSLEMATMGKSILVYGQVETIEEINQKIECLTAEQLIEVANEIFNTDNLSMLTFESK